MMNKSLGTESGTVVGTIMVRDVVVLPPTATVREACGVMDDKDVRCIVVVDDSDGVRGILTDSDVVFRAAGRGDLSKTAVADIMTPEPYCVSQDLDTNEAIRLMGEHGFRRLPVTDGDQLVGLVSVGDVIRAFMRRLGT